MEEHMQNEHGRFCAKDRSYPCSNCHKTFKKNAQLRRHKRRNCCQEDQEVFCFSCGTMFTSQNDLKDHMKNEHFKQNNANQTKLEIILESNEEDFVVPRKVHEHVQLTQLTCDLCIQKFEGMEELKYHIERNHPADLDNLDTTLHSTGEEKTEMGEITMFNDMQVFRGEIDRPLI